MIRDDDQLNVVRKQLELAPAWKLVGIVAGRKCSECEASQRSDST
jgi:hypothetical protein